jgi:hypothetical protein
MIVAMPTLERFTTSIGLAFYRIDVQTLVASLAGVVRVNCNQLHTILHALVAQKQSQLEECPTVRTPPFRFVSGLLIGARSDAGQIFNCNDVSVDSTNQQCSAAKVPLERTAAIAPNKRSRSATR